MGEVTNRQPQVLPALEEHLIQITAPGDTDYVLKVVT
jgi:hypothetical protein